MDENGFIIRKRLPSPHTCSIMLARLAIATAILIFSALSMAAPALGGALQLESPVSLGRAASAGGLFVVLFEGGKDKPAGLQIIDAADSQHPRPRGFFALPGAKQLEIAADGKQAMVVIPPSEQHYSKETAFQVIALDLTDPDTPKETWRETVTTTQVTLAPGATVFAYSHVVDRNKGTSETIVVPTANRQSRTALRDLQSYFNTVAFSPSGKLLAFTTGGRLSLWDLRTPKPQAFEQAYTAFARYPYGCITAVLDNGHIVMGDARAPQLGIYQATADMPRISTVSIGEKMGCPRLDANGPNNALILSDFHGQVWRVNLTNPQQPSIEKTWQLPAHTGALAVSGQLLLAQDTSDKHKVQVFRLDIEHAANVDWLTLDKAHREILEKYEADKKAGKWIPADDATTRFEKVGAIQAIDAPVSGISAALAAEILNDFGFLAQQQQWIPPSYQERALRQAIALDPKRRVAYLNLADLLRKQLAQPGGTGSVRVRREEVAQLYRTYLAMGGKRTASIDLYFAAPTENGDVCEVIAAYANANRLTELVSDTGLDIPFGGRRIDLAFTTEGTAHVPAYYAFDTAHDFPLNHDELPAPPPGAADLWGGDNLGLLTYNDRHFILYHRDLKHPVSARDIASGAQCRFKVETVETIGPKALDRELCARLQGKNAPPTLSFAGQAKIPRKEVSKRWSESEIERTQMLDIANDGTPVNVAEIFMASGAGAGCDATFYDLLDATGTSFDNGPKRDMLLKLQNITAGNRYPVRCQNKPRFFTHQGKIHFETRPATWPPIDDWNKYHDVRRGDNGEVREICDFKVKTRVSVDRRPLEAPARPEN